MPIYWGSTEIPNGSLKLGGSDITAVYWGATQIWPPVVVGGTIRALENGTDGRALENGTDVRVTEAHT